MEFRTLKAALIDWVDWDVAGYSLGVCLGLWEPAPAFGTAKHVFWSNHPIGELLFSTLDSLAESGVLEKREEPDTQYRWNEAFVGSWDAA